MRNEQIIEAALIPGRVARVGARIIDDEMHAVTATSDFAEWIIARLRDGRKVSRSHGSALLYAVGLADDPPSMVGREHMWFDPTLPDIDVDLEDTKRHLAFEHIEKKYGAERVARIGTVLTFKAKSALKEVGMALQIPLWKMDAVAESMIVRSSGDSRALSTIEDTLVGLPAGRDLVRDYPEVKVVTRMEGHPRGAGQHAAGVVISDGRLEDIVAVDRRTGATMCDKEDAEGVYGLLKIDVLGLTQLSIFADTLRRVGLPHDHLDRVPLDDPSVFDVINSKRFSGIFQFEGPALQSIAKQIVTSEFEDFVAMTALARPGPLASGGTTQWVQRRNGSQPVTYPHPLLEPFLKQTRGIIIYQEQILTLGRAIGELDWPQLTALRKAMSKSLGKEYFDQFGDPWKAAAVKKGMDPKVAEDTWTTMCAYGAYGFNRSHAYSYGLISYWCAWLKAHHPLEFIAATLSATTEPAAQISLLRDIVAEGYDYISVDKDTSTEKWEITERDGSKVLVGPLTNVKGIGGAAVAKIMEARGAGLPMPSRYAKMFEKPVTGIDSLFPIRDAIRRICPDLRERNIFTQPTLVAVLERMKDRDSVLVCAVISKINPRDENEVIQIAKRGGRRITDEYTTSLNIRFIDDTGECFGKVDRYAYETLGKPIVDRGNAGKAIWALKGNLFKRGSMTMLMIKQARFLGMMDDP